MKLRIVKIVLLLVCIVQFSFGQNIKWMPDGNAYMRQKEGGIIKVDPMTETETVLVKKDQLIPAGASKALVAQSYSFNANNTKLLIFTNTVKVWRLRTKGDYWLLDINSNKLTQMGKGLASQSLMFAKLSPDGKKCAYVSEHNLFVEDLASNKITKLTTDGTHEK